MDSTIRLGRLFGFEIKAQVLGLIIWGIFALQFGGTPLGALLYFIGIASAVVLHEVGHAYEARRRGMHVPGIALHAFGGLTMWQGRASWRDKFWITAAGPLVNLVLAALGYALLTVSMYGRMELLYAFGVTLFGMNLFLALFNLLPIHPLDGGMLLHTYLNGKKGPQVASIAYLVGVVAAALVGLYALMSGQIFMVIFLALFGWQSWQKWTQEGPTGGLSAWLAERRGRIEHRRANDEQAWVREHRREIDEALRQSLERGIHSLSPRQRELIQRARRYSEWRN